MESIYLASVKPESEENNFYSAMKFLVERKFFFRTMCYSEKYPDITISRKGIKYENDQIFHETPYIRFSTMSDLDMYNRNEYYPVIENQIEYFPIIEFRSRDTDFLTDFLFQFMEFDKNLYVLNVCLNVIDFEAIRRSAESQDYGWYDSGTIPAPRPI